MWSVRRQPVHRDSDHEGGSSRDPAATRGTDHQHQFRDGTDSRPYMALYVSSKQALERYSESLDHEVACQARAA
jgi:hypothetical protein